MSVAGEEAVDRAQNFSGGPVSAARQRERWQQAQAKTSDEETRAQYQEAIADLEFRYADLEDIPPGGAEAFARERGHGTRSRSPVHQGRHRPQPSSPQTRPRNPKAGKTSPKTKPAPARSSRRRGGSPTPRVDRAIAQTGLPAAAGQSGSLFMAMIGATVALSLLFLVVTSAERPGSGARAIPSIVSGVTNFVGRFISLQDFWGAKAAPATTGASTQIPRNRLRPKPGAGAHTSTPEFIPPGMKGPIGVGQGRRNR